jgi:hypothetical protein
MMFIILDGDKMKSYVKIYGPPLLAALRELTKVADEMPEIPYHYHYILKILPVGRSTTAPWSEDLLGLGEKYVAKHKTAVSNSGHTLGEHDFFFEWEDRPNPELMRTLIEKIDKALTPLGCKYTLTTR